MGQSEFSRTQLHDRRVNELRGTILAERRQHRKPSRPAKRHGRHAPASPPAASRQSQQEVTLRRAGTAGWELVHPRCAQEREEDLAEINAMLTAGETDIAKDELIWLLDECHDYIDAHRLLGELALAEDDLPLARGHFGAAFRAGQRAIQTAGNPRPVPNSFPANQGFHESGKGLVWCLLKLDKSELAAEVAQFLVSCDPADPLGVQRLADREPER